MYRETLGEFDVVVVCADRSVNDFRKIGVRSRFAPYPWPSAAAESPLAREAPAKPSFIFFGRLGGLGSRSSFHFLLDRLYPELVSNWGPSGFVLDICGLDQLPGWAQKSLANKPEMTFLGFVPDLDAQMRRYHAMVVPIDVPVGNRTRILTAMANGLPVVAHTSVALGNPSLVDGETCRLANDTGGFARALKWCVDEPDAALAMAQRARSSWKAEYSPEKASALFVDALAQARQ
jgi:glycosyltransferase involved in cell wall biosynthesis